MDCTGQAAVDMQMSNIIVFYQTFRIDLISSLACPGPGCVTTLHNKDVSFADYVQMHAVAPFQKNTHREPFEEKTLGAAICN